MTPDGIVMDDNDSQFENAPTPMDDTEDGMIIDVRFVHL